MWQGDLSLPGGQGGLPGGGAPFTNLSIHSVNTENLFRARSVQACAAGFSRDQNSTPVLTYLGVQGREGRPPYPHMHVHAENVRPGGVFQRKIKQGNHYLKGAGIQRGQQERSRFFPTAPSNLGVLELAHTCSRQLIPAHAGSHPLTRANCLCLFPALHSVTSYWDLELGRGGRIYTSAISKHCKSGLICLDPGARLPPTTVWDWFFPAPRVILGQAP